MRCVSDKLLIQEDPALYYFINQGCLTVDNMDDKEEMQIVDVRQFPYFNFLILYLLQKQFIQKNRLFAIYHICKLASKSGHLSVNDAQITENSKRHGQIPDLRYVE